MVASVTDQAGETAQDRLTQRLAQRLYGARLFVAGVLVVLGGLFVFGQLALVPALIAACILIGLAMVLRMFGEAEVDHHILASARLEASQPEVEEMHSDALVDGEGIRALLQAVPSPVAIIDKQANVIAANAVFTKLFGQTTVGAPALIRFRNPDVHNAISNAIEHRQASVAEFADRGQVGHWFELSVVPLGEAGAEQDSCLLYFRDLSEARRLEKMRTDFVGNASHELRTPLASLKGYLETLAGAARNDPEARERFIGIMLEQAERMERLIDDLLSLSRFETGMGRASFEPTDLSDILFHVRSALTPMAEKTGVALDVDDEALVAEPLPVNGSRDELIQLFENLVENAIKYGDDNTQVKVSVDKAKEFGRDVFKVTVTDNGPGIAPEHIPRLTERFYRVDVQTSREKQGTGLGLAIVKHILTRHDGTLSVQSELGQGSEFIVTIPRLITQ